MLDDTGKDAQLIKDVSAALEKLNLVEGLTNDEIRSAAQSWLAADFDETDEIEAWLLIGCTNPHIARQLDDAGITPAQAAFRTTEGNTEIKDFIYNKFARGELSLAEARRIITNEFWNN